MNTNFTEQSITNYSFNDSISGRGGPNNSYSMVLSEQFSNVSDSKSLIGVNLTELLANRSKNGSNSQPKKASPSSPNELNQVLSIERTDTNKKPSSEKTPTETLPSKNANGQPKDSKMNNFKSRVHEDNSQINQAVPLSIMDNITEEKDHASMLSANSPEELNPLFTVSNSYQQSLNNFQIDLYKKSQNSKGEPSCFLAPPRTFQPIFDPKATTANPPRPTDMIQLQLITDLPDPIADQEISHSEKQKHLDYSGKLFELNESFTHTNKSFAFNQSHSNENDQSQFPRDSRLQCFKQKSKNILPDFSAQELILPPPDTNSIVLNNDSLAKKPDDNPQHRPSEVQSVNTSRVTGRLTFYDPVRCLGLISVLGTTSSQTVFLLKADIERSGLTEEGLLSSLKKSDVILSFRLDALSSHSPCKQRAIEINREVLL
jgi:hypothetical protein